jgi:hypothetical protein
METKVAIDHGMIYGNRDSYWGCRFMDGLSWFKEELKYANYSIQHIECLDGILNQLNVTGYYQYPQEGSEGAKLTYTAMHIYMLTLEEMV